MISFFIWYLIVSLVGWLIFPLAYRFFQYLPDRGYTLSRPLGLLLWGYLFWILASLQILQNDIGGILFALLLLTSVSVWTSRGTRRREILKWLQDQKRLLVIGEGLFFLAFAGFTLVRAANPEILGTEKPMELAFINAILRSPTFPPFDPWLSGYSISYYYFGYVLVAIITRISGVVSGIAFNLAVSLWFGLTALASYGVVFSLLSIGICQRKNATGQKRQDSRPSFSIQSAQVWALLGPLFILIVSNLEGFLEMLHARGLFWRQAVDGSWHSRFWEWINILEINQPPHPPFSWVPERISGIWWWRASRVLQDFDLIGQSKEIIDEFPFFSYLLADLHPHVLSMPFVILAIGFVLNIYLQGNSSLFVVPHPISWLRSNLNRENPSSLEQSISILFGRLDFWLASLILGGLAFLNFWDFPIYVGLLCSVYTLLRIEECGWSSRRIWDFICIGVSVGIAGIFLYLPFHIGFSSQAGGFLPSLSFFTRGIYFWIMFAQLLVPIFIWLFWLWRRSGDRSSLFTGVRFTIYLIGGLWILSYFLGVIISYSSLWGNLLLHIQGDEGLSSKLLGSLNNWSNLFYGLHGSSDPGVILIGSLVSRISKPGTWLTLAVMFTLAWGLLTDLSFKKFKGVAMESRYPNGFDQNQQSPDESSPNAFVLLLVLLGCSLVLVPEFIYLRDQFGWRMNTIFKFYFQVWIIWGLSAAYVSALLWKELKSGWRVVYRLGLVFLLAMALAYPIFGLRAKTNNFNPETWTLNGTAHMERYAADELEAIRWLQKAPLGVVSEAVGGSYTNYARVATNTGQPNVLGWPGHESQWRGGAEEMGSRESDIERLYRTPNWNEAKEIIDRYGIRYLYIGSLEYSTYRVNETKFQNHLDKVFQQGSVIIYEVPDVEENIYKNAQ